MDQFEKALEADIAQLAEQIQASRDRSEGNEKNEVQILKEAMKVLPRPVGQQAQIAPTPPPAGLSSVLPAYAQNAAPEAKLEIEYLVDVALRNGIGAALAQAEKSSPFVEDAVRDVLAGKLYPELQKRGILK